MALQTALIDGFGNVLVDGFGNALVTPGTVPPPIVVASTDFIAYILQFANLAAAQADSVVGAYYKPAPGVAQEVLVFPDLEIDSVVSASGYWVLIAKSGGVDLSLFDHPNIELVYDQTLFSQGEPSVLLANIPTQNVGVVINVLGTIVPNGLIS